MNLKTSGLIAKQDLIIAVVVVASTIASAVGEALSLASAVPFSRFPMPGQCKRDEICFPSLNAAAFFA